MWNRLDLDEAVWSVYQTCMGNAGSIEEARQIFDKMVDRDVVSWTDYGRLWKRDLLCSWC